MNKRDAINEILLSLNEAPLDIDDDVADIQIATIIDKQLDITKKKILSKGWHFNTITMSLMPNVSGYIVIPESFISVDGTDTDVIVRDWKLYDKENNTFVFTDAVECEIVQDIDFDDIPYHFSNYITAQASLETYINIIGNTDDIAIRRMAVDNARIDALREDANSIDGNLLTDTYASDIISRTGL